jgi:signal peptidase I
LSLAMITIRAASRAVDLLLIVLIALVLLTLIVARGLPFITGGTAFVIAGGSMDPAIPMGSVVLSTPVAPNELRPGDVVSLQAGSSRAVVTHRVMRLANLPDGLYLETRGDANPSTDPALVSANDVVGRVALTAPYAGYAVALLATFQGVMFVVSLAAVLLAAGWLIESLEEDHRQAAGRPERAQTRTATLESIEAEVAA